MTDHLTSRLAFMEFTAKQQATLRAVQPVIGAIVGQALDRFYARVAQTPETKRFFRDDAHVARAKSAQEAHWSRIASANFDADYYASTRRIGATHARIGLEPRWYVGSYAIAVEELLRAVYRRSSLWRRALGLFRRPSAGEAGIAVVKAALLDMELSLSIYFEEAQVERNVAIARLEEALTALSKGDLANEVSDMPATFSGLQKSYNGTIAKMRAMIGAVNESAMRIDSGAMEIAKATEDLAERTQSNAASLEQTSAAVSQMDERLRTTAEVSQGTVECADRAFATVAEGRSIADHAVQAMGRVSDCARGIDTVIEGLDKIAFQTRVLAMNAAVEAGRAGDAGRGFAVVADLVSALAMRAEEEAKRAREQLTNTQDEIAGAVDAVRQVDGALAGISENVGQVHGLLDTMARDNGAQATAIAEVAVAIGSMDRSTQQNAAMVEQTSAATRNLAIEVGALAEMAAAFQIGSGTEPRPNVSAGAMPTRDLLLPVRPLPAAAIKALTRPH